MLEAGRVARHPEKVAQQSRSTQQTEMRDSRYQIKLAINAVRSPQFLQ
jgi:hypothetical protein